MDILLIRHGCTEPNTPETYNAALRRPDPPLNETGRRQAQLLGARLRGYGLQRLYSSDLIRAKETAEILSGYLHIPVEPRKGLREIDMGQIHHMTWEQYRREDPEYHDRWHRHEQDLPYPGGESGQEAADRVRTVLEDISKSGLPAVGVVVHGGVIRVALCAVLGIGQEKRFLFGPPENTSITTLRFDNEKSEFSVTSVNDASHLCDNGQA